MRFGLSLPKVFRSAPNPHSRFLPPLSNTSIIIHTHNLCILDSTAAQVIHFDNYKYHQRVT